MTKAVLNKQNKAGGIILPDFKIHCKITVTVSTRYQHKKIQQDKTESSETNLNIYSQLIFNKSAKNTQQEKDSIFKKNGDGKTGCLNTGE